MTLSTTLAVVLWIYVTGAGMTAALFLLIHFRLVRKHKALHREMMKLAPTYILFWFWRLFGFPAYACLRMGPRRFFSELRREMTI